MDTASIRKKLISDISTASDQDLKKLFKLHALIKKEKLTGITWDTLTGDQKEKIETGIQQLKSGQGIPAKKVMSLINKKYGITS